jgi:hypothetical protein
MNHLAAANQAFLLLLIIVCLGSCFVRVFWQWEQVRARRSLPQRRPSGTRK